MSGSSLTGAAVLALALGAGAAPAANELGVAVIIGNKEYADDRVPAVSYAHNDADAFKRFVTGRLGFDEDNVIDLRDATKSQLETAFGVKGNAEGLVWRYIDPSGGSDVVVFYSGHGVPGKAGRGYLLPADSNPDTAELNGYPIDLLYENLGGLSTRSTTVFLDACFSGGSPRGMLIQSASPVYVEADVSGGADMTVLTAASGAQLASWDEEARHGLFTEHLLDGLYGAADADGDGQVTAREAKLHLDRTMTRAARREFGRVQDAGLHGDESAVLSFSSVDGWDSRPLLGPPPAAFTVLVEPAAARIRILNIGPPYQAGMQLPAGSYEVEASAPGYVTKTETVAHGSSATVHRMALMRPGQPFTVVAEPAAAQVRLLDHAEPYQPGMILPPGSYRVEASALGHTTKTETVAHGSSPTTHRMALSRPGQPFTVVVEPAAARVRLLDHAEPYQPGMMLPPGSYRVQASADGYETATESVSHGTSPTVRRMTLRKTGPTALERGRAFLAENAKRAEVVTTASGLQYEVLASGTGEMPSAEDQVTTHYHGTLIDGLVFDSSVQRGQPLDIRVNDLIAGWQEALQMMRVGDKWKLYVPSELAYGKAGAGAAIGPDEVLILPAGAVANALFEVELLAVASSETAPSSPKAGWKAAAPGPSVTSTNVPKVNPCSFSTAAEIRKTSAFGCFGTLQLTLFSALFSMSAEPVPNGPTRATSSISHIRVDTAPPRASKIAAERPSTSSGTASHWVPRAKPLVVFRAFWVERS